MIASFTVTWNQLEYVKMCIWSFYRAAKIPQEFFVVDNCSDDGTYEYLKRLEQRQPSNIVKLRVVRSDKNVGHALATQRFWQEYLHRADIKFLFRFKSTLLVPRGAQEAALKTMEKFPDLGILGFPHGSDQFREDPDAEGSKVLEPLVDVAITLLRKQVLIDNPEFQNVQIRCGGNMALDFWSAVLAERTKWKRAFYSKRYEGSIYAQDFKDNPFLEYESDREYYKKIAVTARERINSTNWLPQSLSELA
jgi:GT2 family glycosyltransferase